MIDELLKHGGTIGILAFLLYREFISHATKTERENVKNMRIELEAIDDKHYRKLGVMHDLLRDVHTDQLRMKDNDDRLVTAVEKQTEALTAFASDMRVMLARIEASHKAE